MKSEKLFHLLLVFLLAGFTLLVLTFAASWAARLLSKEEMAQIRGGDGPPTAVAKAEAVTTTAKALKRKLVQFDGSASTGGSLTYSWNFGDGGTASVSNPTHRYSSTGTYNAVLTVTNYYGSNSDTVTVKVVLPYAVRVSFSGEHTLKYNSAEDSNGHYGWLEGNAITDPVWDSTIVSPYSSHDSGDKNEPVVYTKQSAPTVVAKVWPEDSLTQSTSIHLDAVGTGPLNFDSTGGNIQNGISADFTLPASTNNKFYNYVYKYNRLFDI